MYTYFNDILLDFLKCSTNDNQHNFVRICGNLFSTTVFIASFEIHIEIISSSKKISYLKK